MTITSAGAAPYRVGKWLPSDQAFLESWMGKLIAEVDREDRPLHPVVQQFKDFI